MTSEIRSIKLGQRWPWQAGASRGKPGRAGASQGEPGQAMTRRDEPVRAWPASPGPASPMSARTFSVC